MPLSLPPVPLLMVLLSMLLHLSLLILLNFQSSSSLNFFLFAPKISSSSKPRVIVRLCLLCSGSKASLPLFRCHFPNSVYLLVSRLSVSIPDPWTEQLILLLEELVELITEALKLQGLIPKTESP